MGARSGCALLPSCPWPTCHLTAPTDTGSAPACCTPARSHLCAVLKSRQPESWAVHNPQAAPSGWGREAADTDPVACRQGHLRRSVAEPAATALPTRSCSLVTVTPALPHCRWLLTALPGSRPMRSLHPGPCCCAWGTRLSTWGGRACAEC